MSNIEQEVNSGLLLYAVQRKMWCPECNGCLDVSTAVLLTSGDAAVVSCGECFDHLTKDKPTPAHVEVIDGRAL